MSEVEIKAAILETLNAYSGAAAKLDIKEYLSYFQPDALFYGVAELLGQESPLKGHEEIGQFFSTMFTSVEWLMQQNTTTSIIVSADGRSAQSSTGLVEYAQMKDGPLMNVLARYDDVLALTGAGWKFTKRSLIQYKTIIMPEQ